MSSSPGPSYLKVLCLFPMYFLYCSASEFQDQGHSDRRHTESLKPLSRSSPLLLPSPSSLGLCVCPGSQSGSVLIFEDRETELVQVAVGLFRWYTGSAQKMDSSQGIICLYSFIRKTVEAEDSTKILNSVCLILIFVLIATLPPLFCFCCWVLLLF